MKAAAQGREGALGALRRVDDWIARVEGVMVVASLGLMLLLYFLYVVFRNVSASLGEGWLSDLPLHLVLIVSYLGTSLAARRGRHIGIDIAPRVLPPAVLRVVRIGVEFVACFMAAVLAYAGWRYLTTVELAEGMPEQVIAITFGETTALRIPVWLFVAVAPLGFAFTAFHFLVRGLRRLVGQDPDAEHVEDDGMEAAAGDEEVTA